MPKSSENSKKSNKASGKKAEPAKFASNSKSPENPLKSFRINAFTWISGLLVMLGILKFGTPIILQDQVETPNEWIEWMFFPWPMETAYVMFAAWVLMGIRALPFRKMTLPKFLWLPLVWLGWQFLSSLFTVDKSLTQTVLAHFIVLIGLFYGGYFLLSQCKNLRGISIMATIGLIMTMWSGTEQKFGGLEATRQMIYQQSYWQTSYPEPFLRKAMSDQPWLQSIRRNSDLLKDTATEYGFSSKLEYQGEGDSPLERDLAFLEKIGKDRIFGTLFYPNALAAAILLLLPLSLYGVWNGTSKLQLPSRLLILACIGLWAFACIYWSGSKGGWLVAMITLCFAFLFAKVPKPLKVGLVLVILIGGGGLFSWKYQDYFQKGATSVGARFEYWRAAWKTSLDHPVLGTGPGTFMRAFSKTKAEGAEMTRLTHNDYLQQASDAGWPSAIIYAAWMLGSLYWLRPKKLGDQPIREVVWFGLVALALQNFIEFGLYIPAIAWPYFLLLGWLWGTSEMKETALNSSLKPS
jgi:hypothetical protein